MSNVHENALEEVKNEILINMRSHVDTSTVAILTQVLNKAFSNIEVKKIKQVPATNDDINAKIIEMFRLTKANKLSDKTVAYYLDTIRSLVCFTNKALVNITSMDIELFLVSIAKVNDAVSVNNHRRNISAFYTWMRKSHMILENPCEAVEVFKEVKKLVDYLLPEEFEQLKQGCKYKRDRAMIEFLRCTALRVGEVVNIKVSDINWADYTIQVYEGKTKAYRTACLDSVAAKYLTEYISSRRIPFNSNEALFTSVRGYSKPLDEGGIRGALYAICNRAGLSRRVYPHLFRKTTATNIVKRGGSVQDAGEYLGHKDRTVTGRHYVNIGDDHVMSIFNKFVAMV